MGNKNHEVETTWRSVCRVHNAPINVKPARGGGRRGIGGDFDIFQKIAVKFPNMVSEELEFTPKQKPPSFDNESEYSFKVKMERKWTDILPLAALQRWIGRAVIYRVRGKPSNNTVSSLSVVLSSKKVKT